MLSPQQHKARDGKVTASFLPSLMSGDKDKILREWKRLVGDPTYEAEAEALLLDALGLRV